MQVSYDPSPDYEHVDQAPFTVVEHSYAEGPATETIGGVWELFSPLTMGFFLGGTLLYLLNPGLVPILNSLVSAFTLYRSFSAYGYYLMRYSRGNLGTIHAFFRNTRSGFFFILMSLLWIRTYLHALSELWDLSISAGVLLKCAVGSARGFPEMRRVHIMYLFLRYAIEGTHSFFLSLNRRIFFLVLLAQVAIERFSFIAYYFVVLKGTETFLRVPDGQLQQVDGQTDLGNSTEPEQTYLTIPFEQSESIRKSV